MASGIKDKVAIIGMGCTRFGERWDVGAEELMVEAFQECLQDGQIKLQQLEGQKTPISVLTVPLSYQNHSLAVVFLYQALQKGIQGKVFSMMDVLRGDPI